MRNIKEISVEALAAVEAGDGERLTALRTEADPHPLQVVTLRIHDGQVGVRVTQPYRRQDAPCPELALPNSVDNHIIMPLDRALMVAPSSCSPGEIQRALDHHDAAGEADTLLRAAEILTTTRLERTTYPTNGMSAADIAEYPGVLQHHVPFSFGRLPAPVAYLAAVDAANREWTEKERQNRREAIEHERVKREHEAREHEAYTRATSELRGRLEAEIADIADHDPHDAEVCREALRRALGTDE